MADDDPTERSDLDDFTDAMVVRACRRLGSEEAATRLALHWLVAIRRGATYGELADIAADIAGLDAEEFRAEILELADAEGHREG